MPTCQSCAVLQGISIATLGLSSVDSVESDLRMINYILANLKSVKVKKREMRVGSLRRKN